MRLALLSLSLAAATLLIGDAPPRAPAEGPPITLSPAPAPVPDLALSLPRPLPPAVSPITELPVDDDLPAYVIRPASRGLQAKTVFLTGSCTTPLTYLKAFHEAAAAHGGLVALQGDTLCRDGTRRWSPDTLATAARIDAALRAAGIDAPVGITLVGYSQGAERAEWLAHRFPAKYTRFVLMAGPIVPSRARFAEARGVVTLAGYGDVRENMATGAKRLRRASIPAVYMELPGVQHGELAPAVNDVVARAFDWLDENALATAPTAPHHARGARAHHARAH